MPKLVNSLLNEKPEVFLGIINFSIVLDIVVNFSCNKTVDYRYVYRTSGQNFLLIH